MKETTSLIISAPSGTGKTTILNYLFETFQGRFSFSVSATTRKPRQGEEHGKHYYFISQQEFEEKIKNDDFLEYESVYEGLYYGTLKTEIQRINDEGKIAVFDVDVKGGVNIKSKLKDKALAVFLMPPSIEELKKRLQGRNTESEETLNKRLQRAEMEISYSKHFDKIIINDDLDLALKECTELVKERFNI